MKCKCGHDIAEHDKYTTECVHSGCHCDSFYEDLPICVCGHAVNYHQAACCFCSCASFSPRREDRLCLCGHSSYYHDDSCHLCACGAFRLVPQAVPAEGRV